MPSVDFMESLKAKLIESGRAETTALKYIANLYTLNNKKNFKNLVFLKDIPTILERIDKYKLNTQKSMIASAVAVLKLLKLKPYKKITNKYVEIMEKMAKEASINPQEMSLTQKNNWVSWEDVEKTKADLEDKIRPILESKSRKVSPTQFNNLLKNFVLSLYIDIPPRRNQDYLKMVVCKNEKACNDPKLNYCLIDDSKFIFNTYKTSRKYGRQEFSFEDREDFKRALYAYLRFHPVVKGSSSFRFTKFEKVPLLVKPSGEAYTAGNSITRILNSVFSPKKVSSSMLRHIYLTHKYGDKVDEMKSDADAMGHSVATQKEYIKDTSDLESLGSQE